MNYVWFGVYKSGDKIFQVKDDEETPFSEIKRDDLVTFNVTNGVNTVTVDLARGVFFINGNLLKLDYSDKDYDYRLVYFRRVTKVISTVGEELSSDYVTFIGFQVTVDGKNEIRLISCYNNEFTLVTEK